MATQVTPTGASVRLRLLGEPALEVAAGAQTVACPLERKAAGLLALLAIDGPTPRAKVAAMLWPDIEPAAARNNLRQTLHRLHRRAGCEVAETASDVLQLAAGVEHDVGGAADALASDATAADGELLGTLDFSECEAFAAWLQTARERWRSMRRDMLAQIASTLEKDGHIALALHYAQRIVADDPLLEHAHRRLIRLHYLRGDRAAALAAFASCRAVLRHELGASPGPETAQLARLVEASGVLPAPTAMPPPVPLLRAPGFVGRDTEWQQLAIAGRRPRFVVVSGEPGVGKSRLLSEFGAHHHGFVQVGARPGDAGVPFMLLARLLRGVLEGFAPALPATVRADLAPVLPEFGSDIEAPPALPRLHHAAAAVLSAASGLAGCIVDDLHFADEASLDAIVALASADAALSLHWLVAVRPAELSASLTGRLARADLADVEHLTLGPLDATAVRAMLRSLAVPGFDADAWAEPLARHTGGNPLFILETVRQLLSDGPGGPLGEASVHGATLPASLTVERLIEQRLGQLTPEALRLARVAALAPGAFSPALAARVLHLHPLDLAGAWHELEAAQVIRQNAFVHGLVFEATLRSVPEAIASLMRRDIAAALGDGAASA